MHAWFSLHSMFLKDMTKAPLPNIQCLAKVRIHKIVADNVATSILSILPNLDAPHLVRRVDVGLGLEQGRDNSFLARF